MNSYNNKNHNNNINNNYNKLASTSSGLDLIVISLVFYNFYFKHVFESEEIFLILFLSIMKFKSRFSARCAGFLLLGSTLQPFCMFHFSKSCAGLTEYLDGCLITEGHRWIKKHF